MFSKVRLAALLAAAGGGPYLASETQWGRDIVGSVSDTVTVTTASSSVGGRSPGDQVHAHHENETLIDINTQQYRLDPELARKLGAIPSDPGQAPQLATLRINDIRDVVRFDVTPDWVLSRFARVSTVLADLRLEGLRVPVVTGTRVDDFAGTLTYYFDHQGKVQRITFHGFTGDPQRLLYAMTTHYGLKANPSLEAGAYTKNWNGTPVHFLRLSHAPVVYSDAVHQKFTVFFELNQPNLAYGISTEAQRIVAADRHSGRWWGQ